MMSESSVYRPSEALLEEMRRAPSRDSERVLEAIPTAGRELPEVVAAPASWSDAAVSVGASLFLCDRNQPRSIRGVIRRIARALGKSIAEDGYISTALRPDFEAEIEFLLAEQRVAFSSPIWMNYGLPDARPSSSCYILSVADSLDSLFDSLRCQVGVFRSGGGCGQNMSAIRSSRELLATGVRAPGPVEFISAFAPVSKVLRSGGRERSSSNIFLLDVDHPDIVEFVGLDEHLPPNCILSVRASDEFMRQAEEGIADPWMTRSAVDGRLIPTLPARALLERIAERMLETGEPGIQFTDTINSWHTCPSSGPIRGSNPCGEFLFVDDSAATLASVNLFKFFPNARDFSLDTLCHVVDILVTSLDVLVGQAEYPSRAITIATRSHRPVLLGFSNLATTLMGLGVPYDSAAGRLFCSLVASLITARAYLQSARLAERLGPFESFRHNRSAMLRVIRRHREMLPEVRVSGAESSAFVELLHEIRGVAASTWNESLEKGAVHGFRNAQVTAIAPTGTISLLMDCDSTGIEPRLAFNEEKHLRSGAVLRTEMRTLGQIVRGLHGEMAEGGLEDPQVGAVLASLGDDASNLGSLGESYRDVFRFALGSSGDPALSPAAHLKMVEAAAPHVSGGISKTILMSGNAAGREEAIDEVVGLLLNAWHAGVKGLTIYRVGTRRDEPVRRGHVDSAATASS